MPKEPTAEEKREAAKQFGGVLNKLDALVEKATQGGKTPLDLSIFSTLNETLEGVSKKLDTIVADNKIIKQGILELLEDEE